MTEKKSSKRVKIADRLFKRGEVYYYRRGDFEEKLGFFKSDQKAMDARDIFEMLQSRVGAEAFQYRVKDSWPEYYKEREEQYLGKIPGRQTISKRTFDEIGELWERHLRKFFWTKKLADIDDPMWNEYCRKAKVADLTNHRKVFGSFLRWCKINGKMRVLPELQIPAVKRRKRKTLPPEHQKAILVNSNGTLLLFVSFYLFMGIRRGEQIQIRWEYINFNERWMLIPDENTRTRKGRVVPINTFVFELLLRRRTEQIAASIKTPWVFPGRHMPDRHITASSLTKPWGEMIERAGLESFGYQPHDLRATFEHYASKRSDFTDTQREKMAGASMETQKRIYLHGYVAEDLRGLEEVVDFEGLKIVVESKLKSAGEIVENGKTTGKTVHVRGKR